VHVPQKNYGQDLPKFMLDEITDNGLEYIVPIESAYRYFPGRSYQFFPYDFKLNKQDQDILIRIDENTKRTSPHIEFSRNLANLAVNADEADITVRSVPIAEHKMRNTEWMLEGYFTPRKFFHKRKGKLVSFYSPNGSIISIVYLYNNELSEDPILRVAELK
jgi:hypothetical protein